MPRELPLETKLVVILVRVLLRDLLGKLHPHLVSVILRSISRTDVTSVFMQTCTAMLIKLAGEANVENKL